ncbi:hypothetical protein [Paenibacillus xylanexedens]|uniref:Uncharacterized protein n=1 Tax=Paenibacillus xylanexedens TaxID=528191 RepID=A0ABS4RSE8_PAEXY|nr:hypothetical protein [Paenibacillus xylanexedens]MBP2245812.1 hypothetical protein [Paenibacillus xylanexedens]
MKRFYLGFGLTITIIIGLLSCSTPTEAASKKVNLKLSDGGTYYGEVLNGKPHGKGTARWEETEVYSGDWVSGKRQGKGKYTYTLVEGGGVAFENYNESNMGHGTGEFTRRIVI